VWNWRAKLQPLFLEGLRRASPRQTVGVFEYPLNPEARDGWGKPAHQGLLEVLARGEETYATTVDMLLDYEDFLQRIPRDRSTNSLSWDNDYWCSLDAVVQYCFLAKRRPALYMEVGSGFSTMFARRAIDDHGLPTKIMSIDPAPRADIDSLCDELVRCPLESANLELFSRLGPNDLLLIDGSHTAFMNSDTVSAFLDVLPMLPPGVLVGIDDIFLPWDYHPTWSGRWYGEQYLLASMLLSGMKGWSVLFPAFYLTQESSLRHRFDPIWDIVEPAAGRYAMSFWMERRDS
jgi:hypothetical protein